MKFSSAAIYASVILNLASAQPIILGKKDAKSSADLWRDQSIYQIVTDRFARTDGSTSASCDVSKREYCGGSFQGIIDKLDYIQGMGFTAIWISPVVEQIPDKTEYGYGYHGYWMKNIYTINDNFGTADELKKLSEELHDRGMKLMVDIVTNHYGAAGDGPSIDYSVYTPFNEQKYFHDYCLITDYENQALVEECWETSTLPDLKTEDNEVLSVFESWVKDFISNYTIDGLRVDSAKHMDTSFYQPFTEAAGVFLLGEVFDGDSAYTCPYQDYIAGVSNYPLYYPVLRFFQNSKSTSGELLEMIDNIKLKCNDVTLLGNFVENHDIIRLGSTIKDKALIKNAIAFTILGDGIPIIYYGQEQGLLGAEDPENREALWLAGYDTDSAYYKFISKLNQARNQAANKDNSYPSTVSSIIYSDDHTIATKKANLVAIFTNVGASASPSVTLSQSGFQKGDQVVDLLTCSSTTVGDSGLEVTMALGVPKVYASSSVASGIC